MRDDVVETMNEYTEKTGIPLDRLLRHARLRRSKYYEWKRRYGLENRHNGNVPKANWLFEHEKEAIIDYAKNNPEEGYRRLAYRMMMWSTPPPPRCTGCFEQRECSVSIV